MPHISAPSQVHPSQLVTMPDCYGKTVHLYRPQYEGSNILLAMYCSTGLSFSALAERMRQKSTVTHIHRTNLRPNGYDAAAEEARITALLAQSE